MSSMYDRARQDFFNELEELCKKGYELKGLISEPVYHDGSSLVTARLRLGGEDYAYDSTGRWLSLNQYE